MSKQDLEEIQKQLSEEKTRIESELGLIADKNDDVADGQEYDARFNDVGDEVDDSVQEVAAYQVNKSLEITLEKRLRDIKKTLERMEKGDYGVCKYCDEQIDINRLKARPTSGSCVSCKKALKHEA